MTEAIGQEEDSDEEQGQEAGGGEQNFSPFIIAFVAGGKDEYGAVGAEEQQKLKYGAVVDHGAREAELLLQQHEGVKVIGQEAHGGAQEGDQRGFDGLAKDNTHVSGRRAKA